MAEHNKLGFASMIAEIRQAVDHRHLGDLLVAIERTGIYHLPVKQALVSK